MINPQIIEYIRAETAKGTPRDTIIKNLTTSGGWAFSDVESHLIAFDKGEFPVSPISNPASSINTEISKPNVRKNSIIKINILIFLAMAVVIIVLQEEGAVLMSLMFFHAAIMFLGAILDGIRGLVTKKKTNAFEFLATFALMGITGLGTCFLCLAVQGM
ncbi:MAG: hypothetical protein V4686_02375 [Patescibacteria group bacterium]